MLRNKEISTRDIKNMVIKHSFKLLEVCNNNTITKGREKPKKK